MKCNGSVWRQVVLIAVAAVFWILWSRIGLAGEEGGSGEPGIKAQPFVMPYILVLLTIGLGVFLVCFPSKRRDRPRGVVELKDNVVELIEGEKRPPLVLMGMRDVQVNRMLGQPKVKRRGEEIYAQLAQTGQLSDEEAAKVHTIYDHPAGRYEVVFLDRRVVEIKRQPTAAKPEEATA